MNEEIKEILNILNQMAKENKESDNPLQATVILFEILYKVLDYITNLQERIDYLERSNNRREDTILEQRQEISDLEDKITNLQKENEKLKELDENYPIEEQFEEALKYLNIYKSRIDKAVDDIKHELYEHIKLGDEESWNEEFYTDGKLDYRKLLISILETTLKTLQGEDNARTN